MFPMCLQMCVCVFSPVMLFPHNFWKTLKGLVPSAQRFQRQLPATAMGRRVAFVLEGSRGDIQPLPGDPIHGWASWDGFGGPGFFGVDSICFLGGVGLEHHKIPTKMSITFPKKVAPWCFHTKQLFWLAHVGTYLAVGTWLQPCPLKRQATLSCCWDHQMLLPLGAADSVNLIGIVIASLLSSNLYTWYMGVS